MAESVGERRKRISENRSNGVISTPDNVTVSTIAAVLAVLAGIALLIFDSTGTRYRFGPLHDISTGAFGYRVMYAVTWLLVAIMVMAVSWLAVWPFCYLGALIAKNVNR
jgi:hypothetical protein